LHPQGGFLEFAEELAHRITTNNSTLHYNTSVTSLKETKEGVLLTYIQQDTYKKELFDFVIVTTPTYLFLKVANNLPTSYTQRLKRLRGIGAINIILRLQKNFFQDDTYWLSIANTKAPIMAIVEHTNFMNKKYYNNEHIVYLGNYLPPTHPFFKKTKSELLDIYNPFLRKINPTYKRQIVGYEVFKAPFAQPIIPKNYSQLLPTMQTPLPHVYLANIEQVYPWDRGTNYAVELGKKVAEHIIKQA